MDNFCSFTLQPHLHGIMKQILINLKFSSVVDPLAKASLRAHSDCEAQANNVSLL
jgi:hypothetical protein